MPPDPQIMSKGVEQREEARLGRTQSWGAGDHKEGRSKTSGLKGPGGQGGR